MPIEVEKPELAGAGVDDERILGVLDPAADHRVDVDVEGRVLGRCSSFLSSIRRLFFDTSSGSTLSMLICRKSRPASFSSSIRFGTRK